MSAGLGLIAQRPESVPMHTTRSATQIDNLLLVKWLFGNDHCLFVTSVGIHYIAIYHCQLPCGNLQPSPYNFSCYSLMPSNRDMAEDPLRTRQSNLVTEAVCTAKNPVVPLRCSVSFGALQKTDLGP